MGTLSVPGAILLITGWFAFIEYDSFSEPERKQILEKIKSSPALILLIALTPIGIVAQLIGGFTGSVSLVVIGSSLIFLQGLIVSLLFWKRRRWKSLVLLAVIVILGSFIYIPLLVQ